MVIMARGIYLIFEYLDTQVNFSAGRVPVVGVLIAVWVLFFCRARGHRLLVQSL